MSDDKLRSEILGKVREYVQATDKKEYRKGDRIPYAGRVFDHDEVCRLVDSALEFWLTSGRYTARFEKGLAEYLGVAHAYAVNSGSSANLLAFMALTSPLLGERAIRRGDEVITVAAGFPTTVAPIIQYGAVPVFLDLTLPQYNIDTSRLEEALSGKTKAVMLAHTLGNPFDVCKVKDFCKRHGLWLIEDNCDSLGTQVIIDGKPVHTGTIGNIGTSSFYPPHHMTTGEGGAVYTNDSLLAKILLSMRDWGRDCSCPSGVDNKCGHRFDRQFGELPKGYDHKYVYSHFGYNLKITDMQAAIGCAQLDKLSAFTEKRRHNWAFLRRELEDLSDVLVLPEPLPDSNPSWFGFIMTTRDNDRITRDALVSGLEAKGIQTRALFAGNLLKHPCFVEGRPEHRVVGELSRTNRIMRDSFWIGVYPGLSDEMLGDMADAIKELVRTC